MKKAEAKMKKEESQSHVILHSAFYILHLEWSSRQVTLLRRPVISRVLCY
jgi:hypothetical protein